MSFAPLNFYTFAAARGQFLRSDVQALLREAPVSLFSDILAPHDPVVRREAEALRNRLDLLLFAEPRPRAERHFRSPPRSFGSGRRRHHPQGLHHMWDESTSYLYGGNDYFQYVSAECSLGFVLTAVSPNGICSILFGDTREELDNAIRSEFPDTDPTYGGCGLKGSVPRP